MYISGHALYRYCIRTGRSLKGDATARVTEDLQNALREAVEISFNEATKMGFELRVVKKERMFMWHDDIIDEDLCALVRNNVVVTILLPATVMHSTTYNKSSKIRWETRRKPKRAGGS